MHEHRKRECVPDLTSADRLGSYIQSTTIGSCCPITYRVIPKILLALFVLFCKKRCIFVTIMLSLVYMKPKKQKAELIESGLVIEEFGRLNNHAIEGKMDQPRFSFTQ